MTEPTDRTKDVVRMRMALAEAGYPGAVVFQDGPFVALLDTTSSGARIPERIAWLGYKTIHNARTSCWACFQYDGYETCQAMGLGVEDCGNAPTGCFPTLKQGEA